MSRLHSDSVILSILRFIQVSLSHFAIAGIRVRPLTCFDKSVKRSPIFFFNSFMVVLSSTSLTFIFAKWLESFSTSCSSKSEAGILDAPVCFRNLSKQGRWCAQFFFPMIGSMRFDVLEPPQTRQRRFGTVEPPRTHVTKLYTPCYLCNDVVRGGSSTSNLVEPSRTTSLQRVPCFSYRTLKRDCSW